MSAFDIEIATYSFRGARARVCNGARWIPTGIGRGTKCVRVASYYLALPWLALAKDYDLLVEDFAPPCTFALTPLFSRAPVVAVVQWFFAREMEEKYGVPVGWLERRGLGLYRNFIVMADCMRESIRRRLPDSEICVAGCGVDESLFEMQPRDDGYALFLGRLDIHQKGLDVLLHGVAALERGFRLIVIGDGDDEGRLRALAARLGLEDRVEFRGRVTGAPKSDLISRCRFLCMPSRYETFGLVAAEAMACSKPVVASDLPCLRELVSPDTGVLVPVDRVDALRNAMELLWRDPDRCRRMGDAARSSVRHLLWNRIAETQTAFYRDVLRERARRTLAQDWRPAVQQRSRETHY
jgi:glycosyltransferase involved in cell wall biosynthesis